MQRAAVLLAAAALAACGGGGRAPESAAAPSPEPAPATAPARTGGAVAPRSPADPSPAAARAGPSLYQRLGGVEAIRAVVGDFHARIMADARINALFRGVDAEDLRAKLVDQICQATGGPCVYRGRGMREAHRGLNLTNAHFDALVEDLVAALNRYNVPDREKNELVGALGGMRGDIVGQ